MKLGECSCWPIDQVGSENDLFERHYRLYAFFRENVFRDHTEEIRRSIFPPEGPFAGTRILELGCGPGFYSRRLAEWFPQIEAIGIDQSKSLVDCARARASARRLANCHFFQGDACSLQASLEQVDGVVTSRLFLVVRDPQAVLSEIFRVLKPGGRCFIAEPTTRLKTRLPIWAMRIVTAIRGERFRSSHLGSARIMPLGHFRKLVHSQPWQSVEFFESRGYQYAVCRKAAVAPPHSKGADAKIGAEQVSEQSFCSPESRSHTVNARV